MGSRKIGYGEDCHIIDGGIEDVVGSGRGGMGGVDGRSVVVVGGSISGRARVSIANDLSIFSLVLHSLHTSSSSSSALFVDHSNNIQICHRRNVLHLQPRVEIHTMA